MNADKTFRSATRAKRGAMWLLVAVLAGITGTVSYLHALYVVRLVGNTGPVAYLVPFVADLMIVTSSLTLIEAARVGARRPWQPVLSLATGIVVTIVMNVAAGWQHGAGGSLVAGLIPVAFILTLETLLVLIRIWREAPLTGEPAACGHKVATSLDDALQAAAGVMSKRQLADAFEISRARVDQTLPPVPKVAAGSSNGHGPVPSPEAVSGDVS